MKTFDEYRYILRYNIDLNYHEHDRIEELALFCVESGIQEVMLFVNAEEVNEGHLTKRLLKEWVVLAKKVKSRLAVDHIDISVNPWTTIVHCGRGRQRHKEHDFRALVGENGVSEYVSACPLDEKWQDYLCDTFAVIAKEVAPVAIWVEDDWRLHNHSAELGYGGCFCEHHLAEFGKMVGQDVTREELLDKLLAPGKPHPWRAVWLELCKMTLLTPAQKLSAAVKNANPEVRLALMSSSPDTHSVEGRDWHAFQDAFGMNKGFLTRPNLGPYTETRAMDMPPKNARLTIANLKRPLEIYPELENSPRCGPYSKSKRFSVWECLQSVCYGAHGITINHFDMLGTGISLDPEFGTALKAARYRLDTLVKLGIDDNDSEGVDVLFSPKIAACMHSPGQKTLAQLTHNSTSWGQTFATLGISHRYVKEPQPGRIAAVNGQTLRAFSDTDIEKLLAGTVILDAVACEVLYERGYNAMLGIEKITWHTQQDSGFAIEEIHESDPAVYGLETPRVSAQRCSDRILEMTPSAGAEVRSSILKYNRKLLFPALTVFENSIGGTVICMAYPLGEAQFFMGFFTHYRRILMQNLIAETCSKSPVALIEKDPMFCYRVKTSEGTLVAVVNSTSDTINSIQFRVNKIDIASIKVLDEQGQWQNYDGIIEKHGMFSCIKSTCKVEPLEAAFFLFNEVG
jgi:hypothetical protein